MKGFVEKLLENFDVSPDMAMLYDEVTPKGLTYAQVKIQSARVYAYLKNKGIGKEDFVLINLPRGNQPIIAIVGVWRAGAAFALVEDNYAPERIAFIRQDCGCKTEINSDVWDEIMMTEPLEGFEETDPHDAAYAIYTSGTTGNPKGVLHEYGNIMDCLESLNLEGKPFFEPGERGALLAPLNFVASIMVIIYVLYHGGLRMYVVSYTTLKNPMLLMKFMLEKRITVTFLTPSYVRMLDGKTGPFLKRIVVGSEPANHLYLKGVELYNLYAMSESGFVVGVFPIDKSYDTCPIGRPQFELEYFLIDEDGNRVEKGQTGELCFRNTYVRGYMNLPEETAAAFVDGIYHSGDLAREDENGNMTLLGRANDMIKINGNRIEPAEIEAAVKNVLKIDWCAVRGFEEEGQSYLCAYYKDDVTFDTATVREELLKRLPYYMIPAYFMKVDEIPLKATGKLDRKALPAPDASDFVSEYVAPENETQEKICEAFASVLGLSKVGIHDDFYELGGDSLGSIQVVTESGLPGLNTGIIFRGRTPEKIAEMYEKYHEMDDGVSPEEKNDAAMKIPHPLGTEQIYMVDYQLTTPMSTMYNLFSLFRMDKNELDINQMVAALEATIKNHPVLLTTYSFNEDGEMIQRYTPEVFNPILIEKLTEWEFNNIIKDNLVQPFKIADQKVPHKLYRCRVFETEKAAYMFFDVHHSIFDGTSFKVFLATLMNAYIGMELDKDFYYLMLQRREEAKLTPFYEESRKYFEDRYEGIKWQTFPTPDKKDKSNNELGEIICDMDITQEELTNVERVYKVSRNEFFITVAGVAISLYNNYPDICISWIYNGREDVQMMSSVGLMFREMPVAFRFNDKQSIRDIYADVHDQVQKSIEHSVYPYVDEKDHGTENESAYLLYQQDLRDTGDLEDLSLEAVDVRQNQAATQTMLDIEILDGSDGLSMLIDYAASRYNNQSMEHLKDLYIKVAKVMVSNASQEDITYGEIKKTVKEKKSIGKIINSIFRTKKF